MRSSSSSYAWTTGGVVPRFASTNPSIASSPTPIRRQSASSWSYIAWMCTSRHLLSSFSSACSLSAHARIPCVGSTPQEFRSGPSSESCGEESSSSMKRPRDLRCSCSLGNSGTSGRDMVGCSGEDDGRSMWLSDVPRAEGVGVDGPMVEDANGSALELRRVLPADEDRGREYLGTASVEDEVATVGVIVGTGGSIPSS
ncbi:hypothetical protein DFH29DRAFT_955261, partial [Suillus ampliporus]